ncbi:hypothetical protein [Neorhizobium sp. JUb45]|uniref:hypothetical protein n=1 Tax=unclassified Neorhizobium TaxID=2629175 RepID=UPI001048DE99|nr:hypothetical protein [Neorhizobium sp. JUb45]
MAEKLVWTDADFADMGWHDAQLYSISFPDDNHQIRLDIDYIFNWHWQNNHCLGWDVAPCDIIFQSVSDLRIDIDMRNNFPLCINDIRRSNKRATGTFTSWDYAVELDLGVIKFVATGYTQTLRQQPIFSNSQSLTHR